jgi:hypothetical protein
MAKFRRGVIALMAICFIAILLLYWTITAKLEENCWSKYSTEDEAIMNCEVHGE